MKYNVQQDHTKDPTLEEMTEAALQVLSRNPQGFYLFVEGEWQPFGNRGVMRAIRAGLVSYM